MGCPWKNYTLNTDFIQNSDWGYYNESNGDCDVCRKNCEDDQPRCQAFECGTSYCSWWAAGTCDEMLNEIGKTSAYETCRILGITKFDNHEHQS